MRFERLASLFHISFSFVPLTWWERPQTFSIKRLHIRENGWVIDETRSQVTGSDTTTCNAEFLIFPAAWGIRIQPTFSRACRKRRLIMGYKLSYTTGLLYAWSSCMQWGVWVWTIGHWVVLVQVIHCSKGGWVLFLNSQWYPWEEIMSYSHRRKSDIPVTHSSPLSTWLSILFFFFFPVKTTQGRFMGFVGGGDNIAIATALPPSSFMYCIVNIK